MIMISIVASETDSTLLVRFLDPDNKRSEDPEILLLSNHFADTSTRVSLEPCLGDIKIGFCLLNTNI